MARIENSNSFEETYNKIKEKEASETNHTFGESDTLKIPNLIVNNSIIYDELCYKELKPNANNINYITSAVQTVNFTLNNEGGEVLSNSVTQDISKSQNLIERSFNFTDEFFLFLKESDKEKPYLSLKVDNIDLMEETK